MKALISPNESFTWTWVTSWIWGEKPTTQGPIIMEWIPNTTDSIENCQRVVQVEPDNMTFPIALPLHWVDCPSDCEADIWYFKDGLVYIKPIDVPKPEVNT
jgi:hypothetical protein